MKVTEEQQADKDEQYNQLEAQAVYGYMASQGIISNIIMTNATQQQHIVAL